MQLNQSTYETIFLLYIDNELSPKERLEVEAFIATNSNYSLEMEALKATVLSPENIPYAFKENLKQLDWDTTSLKDLEQDWNRTYAAHVKADMQAIPGLPIAFKNTLKKQTSSEGILIQPFRFNQNKFTYAAIAACLMVFVGYQQLTKTPTSDLSAANSIKSNALVNNSNKVVDPSISKESTFSTKSKVTDATIVSNSNQSAINIETVATKKQPATLNAQVSKSNNTNSAYKFQNESIVIAEPITNNSNIQNQTLITKLPSTYHSPVAIDAAPMPINSIEAETTSYELIDTEDPNRTIYIANFEIDGAAFRGITRRVSALLRRNKSEKEKEK
jgi:hypothetical protein